MYFTFQIGYTHCIETVCNNHDSKVYHHIPFNFTHLNYIGESKGYKCLREIPVKMCFAGQKEIREGIKCYENQNNISFAR